LHLSIEVKDKFGHEIPYHNSHPTTEKLISFSHKFTIYSEDDNTTTIPTFIDLSIDDIDDLPASFEFTFGSIKTHNPPTMLQCDKRKLHL